MLRTMDRCAHSKLAKLQRKEQPMSRIDGNSSIAQTSDQRGGGLQDVDVEQFLNLLIAEMQNQDPLNPMDNSEMAQQISQIREIAATDKLSKTLDTVLTGQSLTTASGLIGKEVEVLTDKGEVVRGTVDKVTVKVDEDDNSKREYLLHIGDQAFGLSRVREVTGA
jgi:flagellar basal-body rod modification protein FlgD